MQVSNRNTTRWHYTVFILWLVSTLLAASYFIGSRLVAFDPELKLANTDSLSIVHRIKRIKGLENLSLNNTVIHFTSEDCSCTQFSKEHKSAIDTQVTQSGFTVINVNLSAQLSTIIPSTPAILITNSSEELLYLGPYSIGLACTESNGFVETVLQNYAQGYSSDLIISDVEGCYCNL